MISVKELKQRDFQKEWAWNDIEKNIIYRASCGFYSGTLFFRNGYLDANIENLKLSEEEVVTTLCSLGYRCVIIQTSSNEDTVQVYGFFPPLSILAPKPFIPHNLVQRDLRRYEGFFFCPLTRYYLAPNSPHKP